MHQVQRWVEKTHEARIVAIGDQLFGFAIHAHSALAHVDLRADYDCLDYDRFEVQPDLATGISALPGCARPRHGAFDFVVGPAGFTFLECNAGGQYGWLETRTGAPLTAVLTDLLARGTS